MLTDWYFIIGEPATTGIDGRYARRPVEAWWCDLYGMANVRFCSNSKRVNDAGLWNEIRYI